MGSPTSPLILSFATVFALLGIVLVALAFGTNDWQKVTVRRDVLKEAMDRDASFRQQMVDLANDELQYDRTYGLFRICFPDEVPSSLTNVYESPLGASCVNRNRDYQIPENSQATSRYSEPETARMHLLRTQVAFYITGLAILFICLFVGVTGCWRRSSGLILVTGVLLLFSTLFLAAAMAVWHGVDYLNREVIKAPTYYQRWPEILKRTSVFDYGWSYIISWIGIGLILVSSICMLLAYRAMKKEEMLKHPSPFMVPPGAAMYPTDKQMMMPYAYSTYGYGGYPHSMVGANGGGSYGYVNGGNYASSPYAAGYLTYR